MTLIINLCDHQQSKLISQLIIILERHLMSLINTDYWELRDYLYLNNEKTS